MCGTHGVSVHHHPDGPPRTHNPHAAPKAQYKRAPTEFKRHDTPPPRLAGRMTYIPGELPPPTLRIMAAVCGLRLLLPSLCVCVCPVGDCSD